MLIYVYAHIHGLMPSKNISMTDEAYEALLREKRDNESFTETIIRLTRGRGRLSDCFGSWNMTADEEAKVARELSKGWKRVQERLTGEVS
jgi:predicted CopG family antitoxin